MARGPRTEDRGPREPPVRRGLRGRCVVIGLRFARGEFGAEAGGQLALTTEVTGPQAVCRCGGRIVEHITLTARVWVHVLTGDWLCPMGGQAFPWRWSS